MGLFQSIADPGGPTWAISSCKLANDKSLQGVGEPKVVGTMVLHRGTYHPVLGAARSFTLKVLYTSFTPDPLDRGSRRLQSFALQPSGLNGLYLPYVSRVPMVCIRPTALVFKFSGGNLIMVPRADYRTAQCSSTDAVRSAVLRSPGGEGICTRGQRPKASATTLIGFLGGNMGPPWDCLLVACFCLPVMGIRLGPYPKVCEPNY